MDTPIRRFRFDRWWGLAAGIALAAGDTLLAHWTGFRFQINGRDATFLTGCYFGSSFAALGFGLGWLVEARRHERAQAAIIRTQMGEIAATRQRLAQSEKLAALGAARHRDRARGAESARRHPLRGAGPRRDRAARRRRAIASRVGLHRSPRSTG